MNLRRVAEQLTTEQEVTFTAYGSSMKPKINNGEKVTVERVDPETVKKGDIVLAHIGQKLYLHLVSATENNRVQISNNHGHVNGWTSRSHVLGRVKKGA